MANRTVKDAVYIKGTNPQYLIEKIIRTRIYDSRYWKEECFALTAELLVDKAMELKSIGGVYGGNVKPSPFLCLILKMLQIQPEKEIIIEFIRNEDFKYVRALGAFYMRLIATSVELYKYLEPLYIDYRKMKRMTKDAKYQLVHMDEFIDELLHGERVCDISLPRIQKRYVLEDLNELEPRMSALDVNIDEIETSSSSSSSSESEAESGEEKELERKKTRRHDSSERHESRNIEEHRRKENRPAKEPRRRYVDYDNPDPADEIKRYKRSPSPARKHSRRSRSRSRSRHDDRQRRQNDSAVDRRRDRPRDRSGDRQSRERDGERRRDNERSLDKQRENDRSREADRRQERKKRRESGSDGRETRDEELKKERKKKSKHKRRSDNESN